MSTSFRIYKGPSKDEMKFALKSCGSGFINAKASFYCMDSSGTGYIEVIVPISSMMIGSGGSEIAYNFNCMAESRPLSTDEDIVGAGDSSIVHVDGYYYPRPGTIRGDIDIYIKS